MLATEAAFAWAAAERGAGRPDGVVAVLEPLILRGASSWPVALLYTEALLALDRRVDAITFLKGWPGQGRELALAWAGWLHWEAYELKPARSAFEAAIELDRRCAETWYGLGLIRLHLDQDDAALDALEEAVRLDPEHHRARRNIVDVSLRSRYLGIALPQFTRLVQKAPWEAWAFVEMIGDRASDLVVLEYAGCDVS